MFAEHNVPPLDPRPMSAHDERMHAVRVDRVGDDPDAVVPKVAQALGVTAYDVRASLQAPGGGPAIIAVFAEPEPALATTQALRNVGVDASTIDVEAIERAIGDFVVRRFELGEHTMVVDTRDQRAGEIRYTDVDALVLATSIVSTEQSKVVRETSFSPGRSLLSGGLVNTRTRETTQRTTHVESEELVFVFVAGRSEAVRMGEANLVFQGLGDAIQPARTANFLYLVTQLRRRCVGARVDERLRKRAAQVQLLGRLLSPDDHLDLAVALVAAHLRAR